MSESAIVTTENPVDISNPSPNNEIDSEVLNCGICKKEYVDPKVLLCFHSFCKKCINDSLVDQKIACPKCHLMMTLGENGADGLLADFGYLGMLARKNSADFVDVCQGCLKSKDLAGKCDKCGIICKNCQFAHSHMLMFQEHVIKHYENNPFNSEAIPCIQHEDQPLTHYCSSCTLPICLTCSLTNHIGHQICLAKDVYQEHVQKVQLVYVQAKDKVTRVMDEYEKLINVYGQLQSCYETACTNIDNIADVIIKETNEFKNKTQAILDVTYEKVKQDAQIIGDDFKKSAVNAASINEFAKRLLERSDMLGFLFFSELLETKLSSFMELDENIIANMAQREFFLDIVNLKADVIVYHLRTFFRNITKSSNPAEPTEVSLSELDVSKTSQTNLNNTHDDSGFPPEAAHGNTSFFNHSNYSMSAQNISMHSSKLNTGSMMLPLNESSHMNHSSLQIGPEGSSNMQMNRAGTSLTARSPLKRHKMIYFLKFGEFGVNEGQFTEPSGIAVSLYREEIIIADTNGHRVQVFDREGRFKLEFGGCGKRDGQLLYPNRIAVNQITGNYFITERSPTHQIQIYDSDGHFIRKFGATVLQHPRGICVDQKGRVVIVECKVMRVIIFDSFGNVISKFGCGRYLEFPNAVCTSPDEEILISDNRAHCIKVFSYDGIFLRQIGGEGITNYPIGVAVDRNGYIIVADNHNNFNLTIFDKHGKIINALESKVKHAQCYDMALLNDGTVAVSSKDYRIYLYRYAMPTGNGDLTYLTLPVESCDKFSSLE